MTEDGSTNTIAFSLKRPGFWSWDMLPVAWACGVVSEVSAYFVGAAAGYVSLSIIVVPLVYRLITRPKTGASIELGEEGLVFPPFSPVSRSRTMPYTSLTFAYVAGEGAKRRLYIGSTERTETLRLAELDDPAGAELLPTLLEQRAINAPGGQERIGEMQRRETFARWAWAQPTLVSHGILATLIILFVGGRLVSDPGNPVAPVALGAGSAELLLEGELFRLITPSLLHVGPMHLLLNAVTFWLLARPIERLLGPASLGIICFAAAVAGSAGSALVGGLHMYLGASSITYGLLAAFYVLHLRLARELPGRLRLRRLWWFIIGGNIILQFAQGQQAFAVVDNYGHGFGLAAGFVVGWFLVGAPRPLVAPVRSTLARKVIALVALAATAMSCVAAVVSAAHPRDDLLLVVGKTMLESNRPQPIALNNLAWTIAIDPLASAEELDLALRMSERSVQDAPDVSEFIDTLATLAYRLGDYERAIGLERDVLDMRPDEVTATQLGRFLRARVDAAGPLLIGGVGIDDVRIEAERDPDQPDRAPQVWLSLTRPAPEGAEIYLQRGRVRLGRGLMRVRLPASPGLGDDAAGPGVLLFDGVVDPPELEVLLVDLRGAEAREPGDEVMSWNLDRETAELP